MAALLMARPVMAATRVWAEEHGVNEEDIGMEVQMDEEEAAMKAADEMIEGFWRD